MNTRARPNIAVIGGGFGGLESAFYLRMRLPDEANITLISDQEQFLFKPNTIYVPFGLDPQKLMIPLDHPTHRKNIRLVHSRVTEIDSVAKRLTANGEEIPWDFLVIATGAGMRPAEIPGLDRYAHTIWTPADMLRLRQAYSDLMSDVMEGEQRRVLFLVPPNNKCSGPLYEMVFMLDSWLRKHGARRTVDITWTTYEHAFIQAFGPRLNVVVNEEFDRRGIVGHTDYRVQEVRDREVIYTNGETVPYDLLVSFPPYVASTLFPQFPQDDRGFIATDLGTRQVAGHPEVYAVGDTGDFPVKQAFLAFLQADAAAEHLAARVLGTQPSFCFEPTSMCVMEQFNKATFAQVPLRLTGNPDLPVEVRPDANGAYRVGTSPVWRMGKKMLGIYLPWRFNAGEPFHAGLPWKGMDMGLKVMSHVLAA